MYGRSNPAYARDQYQAIELSSRLASADPHGLVMILYDELLQSLDIMRAIMQQQRPLTGEHHAKRAQSIVMSLIGSLDFERGGPLAQTLGTVYRSLANELQRVVKSNDPTGLAQIRAGVEAIASSWRQLKPGSA